MYALYAGLLWSFLDLPKTGYGLEALFGTCTLVAAALPFVSAMVVGLSLEKFRFRDDSYVLLSAVIISLLIQPALVIGFTNILNLEQNTRVIAQLFSAMPATPLAAVFAVKFGGDASLASKIVTTTLLISAITLPLVALIG
jgi:predicted permease